MTILHVPSVAGQEEGEGSLLAWAERTGRRPAAEPDRGGLRFVFYGRVSTEDYQDPVTSRARQRDQAVYGVEPPCIACMFVIMACNAPKLVALSDLRFRGGAHAAL